MTNQNYNYYKVVAKCGHVGKKHYIPVVFAVTAESGKEASKKVRNFPRVKHQHKDAILRCDKITLEEYLVIKEANNKDPYLKCKNKQQQRATCDLKDRLEVDHHNDKIKHNKVERLQRVNYKLAKYKLIADYSEGDYEYDYAY